MAQRPESSSPSVTPKIIGHRGVPALAPENTLAGIEKAIELGLDYVELDVRTTSDGRLVLLHDADVDRTTGGTGRITSFTAEELKSLDAGSWFSPEFAGEAVPLLDEALALMSGRIGAYLDVKDAPMSRLFDALRRNDMLHRSVVYLPGRPLEVYGRQVLARVAYPGLNIMPEIDTPLRRCVVKTMPFRPEVVAFSKGTPTKELIERLHQGGVRVFVDALGEGDPAGMKALVDLGPDGIQTDHPEILAAVIRGEDREGGRA